MEIQKKINGYFVELDAVNEIYRVIARDKENYIDIAQGVGKNIHEDLMRRDFTINALAICLKTFELVDVSDGLSDLNQKKISLIITCCLFSANNIWSAITITCRQCI